MAPTNKKEKGPSGRPKHEVWNLGFRRVLKHCEKTHRTIHAAYCVLCNKVLCNTASKRLSAHRRICLLEQAEGADNDAAGNRTANANHKATAKSMAAPDNTTSITFVDMDDSQYATEQSSEITKTEYTFMDNPNESFEEFRLAAAASTAAGHNEHKADSKVDIAIAKFFIGCNIPFSVADSSYFKKLCLELNPTCKLVSSEHLAGPLLDHVYSKFHDNLKVRQGSIMLVDGWKNESTNTKNVTFMLKTESNETIFIENYELTNNKDIVQELTDITRMVIGEAYEQFKTDVYALIMGNSCSLVKMDTIDNVWQFPCSSHIVRILIKEYISYEFMNTVCKILRQLNLIFKDDDLESRISSDLRWNNTKCILEYCTSNLSTIQTILSSESLLKLSKEYKCLFFDGEFLHKIESYINFLNCIEELTMVSQNPKSNIADTTEQWLSVQLSEDDVEALEKFTMRRDSVLKIQSLVANYLHPLYRGRKCTNDQLNRVEEFLLDELDSEGLNSLQMYVNGESIFRVLNQKDGLSAQTYWSLARRSHNDLATLAAKMLMIPASITTNIAQMFQNTKNASLKPDKLRKLFAVYYHLKEREEVLEIE